MGRYIQIFVASLLLIFISLDICSQQNFFQGKHFFSSYMLDKNQVNYLLPANFSFIYLDNEETLECLRYDKSRICMSGFYDKIVSKDKNFVAFIYVPPVYSKDSVYIDSPLFPELKLKINTYHLNHILADYKWNMNNYSISLNQCPLHYHSYQYAQTAFNADTVITYPVKVWSKYERKYDYCQVVIIQKNARGLVCLYCFYNDKGKRKWDNYLKSLAGMFWYRDPKDYIEVIESPKSDSIIHIIPRKKKNLIQ